MSDKKTFKIKNDMSNYLLFKEGSAPWVIVITLQNS